VLAAYKYQPNLERRHGQFKGHQLVAPVLLKGPVRIGNPGCGANQPLAGRLVQLSVGILQPLQATLPSSLRYTPRPQTADTPRAMMSLSLFTILYDSLFVSFRGLLRATSTEPCEREQDLRSGPGLGVGISTPTSELSWSR
jgi:hypothetical protein